MIDNLFIGHDEAVFDAFVAETWGAKVASSAAQLAEKEAAEKRRIDQEKAAKEAAASKGSDEL